MLINKKEDTSNNNMYRNSAFIVNVHLTVVNRIACNRTWVRAPVLVGFVLPDMCNVLKLVVFPFVLFWPLCCLSVFDLRIIITLGIFKLFLRHIKDYKIGICCFSA